MAVTGGEPISAGNLKQLVEVGALSSMNVLYDGPETQNAQLGDDPMRYRVLFVFSMAAGKPVSAAFPPQGLDEVMGVSAAGNYYRLSLSGSTLMNDSANIVYVLSLR